MNLHHFFGKSSLLLKQPNLAWICFIQRLQVKQPEELTRTIILSGLMQCIVYRRI